MLVLYKKNCNKIYPMTVPSISGLKMDMQELPLPQFHHCYGMLSTCTDSGLLHSMYMKLGVNQE